VKENPQDSGGMPTSCHLTTGEKSEFPDQNLRIPAGEGKHYRRIVYETARGKWRIDPGLLRKGIAIFYWSIRSTQTYGG